MFIKLTKTDGSPIWLNAAFVVTIEPNRKNNGSLVVPIGDGLDYEVNETPETVLALLDGAPAAAVVPVPASDALKTGVQTSEPGAEDKNPVDKPAARRSRTKPAKTGDGKASDSAVEPKKKTAAKSRTKKKSGAEPEIDDAGLERLRKLAPKSLKKLANTVTSQFNADSDSVIESLRNRKIILVEGERVIWQEHLPKA